MSLIVPHMAAPATPAAGNSQLYVATSKVIATKDDAGLVHEYVETDSSQDLSNKRIALASGDTGVPPLSFTAGSVLTVAAAGAVEFDGTSYFGTTDTTSGRGLMDAYQIFRLAANLGARGAAIADYFDASSAFPTVLNTVYELVWDLYYLKTTAGTMTYTITNTQTYTNIVASYRQSVITGIAAVGDVNEAGIVTTTAAAAALPVTGSLSTAVNHHVIIRALAEIGTAGNVRLRVTQSAGTITPLRGSMFMARRLFAGNVGTFVA